MSAVILFNKPFGTVCRFGAEPGRQTLADWIDLPDIYPAGRLDRESEGLLVLTDDGRLAHRITHPRRKLAKTYWVQVERCPNAAALAALRRGVMLRDGPSRPAGARLLAAPDVEPDGLWPREPPVRYRRSVPTQWLELVLHEGRNRQVRRMTAAVGHPTLRLVRIGVGPWRLDGLAPGHWRRAAAPGSRISGQ
ncbi:MAG: pseudouridine synthase [Halofilum sp. (in: g-proteobacteria)]|nr:pseudouridine synthase [Halofilum sp. (in: g-proteobacteria)]